MHQKIIISVKFVLNFKVNCFIGVLANDNSNDDFKLRNCNILNNYFFYLGWFYLHL